MLSPAATATGQVLFPRLKPGTELRWARLIGGPEPADLFQDQFRYVVYQDAQWDWRTFDLERDFAKANAVDKGIDELDPHLKEFATHYSAGKVDRTRPLCPYPQVARYSGAGSINAAANFACKSPE